MQDATLKLLAAANVACVVGLTVMTLETGANARPQASVAVQVSVTVPPHWPGVAVNVDALEVPLMAQLPERPLVKLIVLGAGTPPQATVMAAGAVIVGNAAGLTVMTLETGANARPQASVAVQVSVTVPPQAPGVAVKVEAAEVPASRQLPDKPLVKLIVLGAGTPPQATVMAAGAVIVGNAAGLTVMVWTHDPVLPDGSVATHVRVIVPPQGGFAPPASLNATVAEQLSVAVAVPVALGVVLAPQATVTLAGQVTTGAVLSVTVTLKEQLAVWPLAAVTV